MDWKTILLKLHERRNPRINPSPLPPAQHTPGTPVIYDLEGQMDEWPGDVGINYIGRGPGITDAEGTRQYRGMYLGKDTTPPGMPGDPREIRMTPHVTPLPPGTPVPNDAYGTFRGPHIDMQERGIREAIQRFLGRRRR
jgi:hypothetical protein